MTTVPFYQTPASQAQDAALLAVLLGGAGGPAPRRSFYGVYDRYRANPGSVSPIVRTALPPRYSTGGVGGGDDDGYGGPGGIPPVGGGGGPILMTPLPSPPPEAEPSPTPYIQPVLSDPFAGVVGGASGGGNSVEIPTEPTGWLPPIFPNDGPDNPDEGYLQPVNDDPFAGVSGGGSGSGNSVEIPTEPTGWVAPVWPDEWPSDPSLTTDQVKKMMGTGWDWLDNQSSGGLARDIGALVTEYGLDQVLGDLGGQAGVSLATAITSNPYALAAMGIAGMAGGEKLADTAQDWLDKNLWKPQEPLPDGLTWIPSKSTDMWKDPDNLWDPYNPPENVEVVMPPLALENPYSPTDVVTVQPGDTDKLDVWKDNQVYTRDDEGNLVPVQNSIIDPRYLDNPYVPNVNDPWDPASPASPIWDPLFGGYTPYDGDLWTVDQLDEAGGSGSENLDAALLEYYATHPWEQDLNPAWDNPLDDPSRPWWWVQQQVEDEIPEDGKWDLPGG